MGIIVKQSVKGSAYSYIGTLLGFINVGLMMPLIFSKEQIGLTNLLVSVSAIIAQLGTLGFSNSIIKLFPFFRDKEHSHHGFVKVMTLVSILGFALTFVLFLFLKPYLIESNIEKSPLFIDYIWYLPPMILITIFYLIYDSYCIVLFNASIGIFYKEFLMRILITAGIVLYYFSVFDFAGFVLFYFLAYSVPTIGLLAYLRLKGEYNLKTDKGYITKPMRNELIWVSFYGLIIGFSGIAVMNIDIYMVNHYCGLAGAGVYSTMFYFGTIILIAGRSLKRIASPLISEAFKKNDTALIGEIYTKSTLTQFIISIYLFLLIWSNIDSAFEIIPRYYSEGKMVVFYIGILQVLTMLSGASYEIIQYSKYYRLYAYLLLVFIAMVIASNMFFIPRMGLTGAALASMSSFIVFAVIRFFFIKSKLGLQPYNLRHLYALIIGLVVFIILHFIPDAPNFIIDIIIKAGITTVFFVGPVYFLNISPDIRNAIKNYFKAGIAVFVKK
ncbi:MAG: polysaccharide biosynthesis C-terminal domain-containing protein [Bacteroidales bacterium]|nr:polysaccharide biosynthesis C-terminal domain-containing protein [Bacteroidales bacterium]HOY38145.1 polysaccharide biosynthesis C-terminal domain-containing protein [Bacteroidales bacterium]HQP03043.1 polysaccharide biosynthesis C-terminal domain-containing protein [Bacteroidales bacterium]